tara:strand:- start:182 stop:301 length:120 start_codon:yes stop_codon:yes gene_type:complete
MSQQFLKFTTLLFSAKFKKLQARMRIYLTALYRFEPLLF